MPEIVEKSLVSAKRLLSRITCPHCWHSFPPEEILWIATHHDLIGDQRLGAEALQRFLPSRFDMAGNAIDSKGLSCSELACPKCHLSVPWSQLDTNCSFFSILGTSGSGKSFLLGAISWTLRRTLIKDFFIDFGDADPKMNATLSGYEESLFLSQNPDVPVPVKDLIPKTQFTGTALFDEVDFGSMKIRLPRPFLFEIRANPKHPSFDSLTNQSETICLYDNAGESFMAISADSEANSTTKHMAYSKALIFLMDPLQDPRFRAAIQDKHHFQGTGGKNYDFRQETILREAASRVRRILGLNRGTLHNRTLVVVINKWDAWRDLLPLDPTKKPFIKRKGFPIYYLDMDLISQVNGFLRNLLMKYCPEIVSAAESFCQNVVYLPASALGHTPKPNPDFPCSNGTENEFLHTVCPKDINPWWADIPLLYVLSKEFPKLVSSGKRVPPAPSPKVPMPTIP